MQEFERGRAFIFLEEVARQFVAEYGLTVATAIAYGMNSEFSQVLAIEMRRFNEVGNSSIMSQVHGQIDELKNIMVQNIDNVTARGERIELLVNKTENLRNSVRGSDHRSLEGATVVLIPAFSPSLSPSLTVGVFSANFAERGQDDVLAKCENVCDSGWDSAVRPLRYHLYGLRRFSLANLHS